MADLEDEREEEGAELVEEGMEEEEVDDDD